MDNKATKKAEAADQKLAKTESPAALRSQQGDWAVSNNPSPEEQIDEAARTDAINRLGDKRDEPKKG